MKSCTAIERQSVKFTKSSLHKDAKMSATNEPSAADRADFEREVRFAATLQLEKFSAATAQHFGSYADLAKISKFKITDPKTNYQQQAGFSAEVKQVARTNAGNILSGSRSRIARTDDLNHVNHQVYDYVEVTGSGAAKVGPNGDFVGGAQMKVHKDITKYRALYKENHGKYQTAKLTLPSDQFDDISSDWDKQQVDLEKQVEALRKKGNTNLAAQKQDEISRIKDARSRTVRSKVSTSDAMEARKAPAMSVCKDVVSVGNKAGLQAGKNAAVVGGGISVVRNVYGMFNGEKSTGKASLNIVSDTGSAAITAYASGAVTATLGGALQKANQEILCNLGKGNTPAMMVQTASLLAKGALDVIRGKITPEQFVGQISREGMTLATSMTGSNFGAVVGTFIAPGVGTIVGGFVGGMVASLVSGSLHSALQQSVRDLELSNEQRNRTQEICARIVAQHNDYRRQMHEAFDEFFLEKRTQLKAAFDNIAAATLRGESIKEGLEGIAQTFGKELAFENGAQVRSRLRSGQMLEF